MAVKKGHTNNPSGRPAGVPNKVTTELKTWISQLIDKNLPQIERDIKTLDPKDRLIILERFMQYAIPKQQSVSVEAQIKAEYDYLEQLLQKAPGEAIGAITDRITELNKTNNGQGK